MYPTANMCVTAQTEESFCDPTSLLRVSTDNLGARLRKA